MKFTKEQIISKLRDAEVIHSNVESIRCIWRKIGINDQPNTDREKRTESYE